MLWPPTDERPKHFYSERSQFNNDLLCCQDGNATDGDSPATFSSARRFISLSTSPDRHERSAPVSPPLIVAKTPRASSLQRGRVQTLVQGPTARVGAWSNSE
jgi:hypothetical protein